MLLLEMRTVTFLFPKSPAYKKQIKSSELQISGVETENKTWQQSQVNGAQLKHKAVMLQMAAVVSPGSGASGGGGEGRGAQNYIANYLSHMK